MSLIWPGLDHIAKGYSAYQKAKVTPFSYPFRIYPPPASFDRGTFSKDLMDRVLDLWSRMRPKLQKGARLQMNTIEIRAAILAIRVNVDWWRDQQRHWRKLSKETERGFELDRKGLHKLKVRKQRTIRSLERHLKRANSRLLAEVGRQEYDGYMNMWRAHVRWIRLRLVYFKPWKIGSWPSKTRYQVILNELERIASGLSQ
jgi:hypothetical protein